VDQETNGNNLNDETTRQPTDNAQAPLEGLIEPESALPPVTLEELPERLRDAATRAGWTRLMDVQARAIPYILAGRDLMVQSRTGSGKTGAYLLPILERIDLSRAACQALVLVPTRELARQVVTEAELLAGHEGIRTIAVYGGVSYGPQLEAFRRGAHLVVGTPGRILDHLMRHSLSLDKLRILVFDEADRMLSMGFYPDMRRIQDFLPTDRDETPNALNAYMFSATFPAHVIRLAHQFLRQPDFLSLSRDHVHVTATEHAYYIVPPMDKDRALVRLIEIENPPAALIFCNTKAKVHYVNVVLQRFGYDSDELSSDLSQKEREAIMRRMREGNLRYLVATDVAARGIDLPDLSHVFIYDPPEDPEDYIHRAGRTGRAGASGEAISLVTGMESIVLQRIGKRYGIAFEERPLPDDEDLETIVGQRLTALLEARLRERDRVELERMQRFMPLAKSLGESEDSMALVAMLLDDYYQKSLHTPPDRPTEAAPTEERPSGRPRRRRRGR
jgi:ATP-dependent RNA helicase DeaD